MSRKWLPNWIVATCLWPGLPQMYLHGAFSGLIMAVGFTALINLLVSTTLVWTELMTPRLLAMGWGLAATIWCIAGAVSLRSCRNYRKSRPENTEQSGADPYVDVIDEYLKGNWYEVETRLREILKEEPRDAEAHLLLATMFRHTGRLREAERRLDELTRLETCEEWRVEIERERQLLTGAQQKLTTNASTEATEEPADSDPAQNTKVA